MFLIRRMDLHCLMIKVNLLSLEFEALQIWQYLSYPPPLPYKHPQLQAPRSTPPSTYTSHIFSCQAFIHTISSVWNIFSAMSACYNHEHFQREMFIHPCISIKRERQGGGFHHHPWEKKGERTLPALLSNFHPFFLEKRSDWGQDLSTLCSAPPLSPL